MTIRRAGVWVCICAAWALLIVKAAGADTFSDHEQSTRSYR